jgi:hypothetical protein
MDLYFRAPTNSFKSKLKLCYDRQSVGQSLLVSGRTWGPRIDFYYCQTVEDLLKWGAPPNERTNMSFTIVSGHRQCSHSRSRVPRDTWPYFTVLHSRISQPEWPAPHIYPSSTGWTNCNPVHWVPFSLQPTTRRVTVEIQEPASRRSPSFNAPTALLIFRNRPYTKHYSAVAHSNYNRTKIFVSDDGNQ